MYNGSNSNVALTNVAFLSNVGVYYGGGMTNAESSPTLFNCIFSSNTAFSGAGMHNDQSSPALTNVTFSGNFAYHYGGGMDITNSSSPALTNTILWGNTAPVGDQIYIDGNSVLAISYSLVQGGCPAGATCDHILDVNPEFVDADGPDNDSGTLDDNLRLQLTSPAIDAGDNSALSCSETTDLDGYPRCVDIPTVLDTGAGTAPIVDMGACEAQLKLIIYLPLVLKEH
jgi:hypothetical protein